jgi:HD superfamily phosphodiesterase
MKNDVIQKVKQATKPTYDKIQVWSHGWKHILNVANAAKSIAEGEGIDPIACQIAAFCHDLGRLTEEEQGQTQYQAGAPSKHAAWSVEPTRQILDNLEIDQSTKKEILEAVELHNIRKYSGDNKILLVLQDADRSDGFNKFSILRMAHFNLGIEMSEPDGEREIEENFNLITEKIKQDPKLSKKMIDTLDFVIDWYEELLNTKTAKILLKSGYGFVKKYRKSLQA